MAAQDRSSRKLKFTEWRPIGVCDDAPLGIQKAQMFSREDFLIVTASGINRNNWRKHPQVVKILNRYCNKLSKQSSRTQGMKQPVVSNITLVGAVMKLVVTPVLNKESKDGKLQFFQVEFEDKGKQRKTPWKLILGLLLAILLILAILLGFVIYKKIRSEPYQFNQLRPRILTTDYCDKPADKDRYARQLDEVSRILQLKADDLLYQGRLVSELNCVENFSQISFKEDLFLRCYQLIERYGVLLQIPAADLQNVNGCRKELCTRKRSSPPDACPK